MLERREIVLPRPELAPELVDELEAFEYSITDSGNVRTSAPSGAKDDCVMGLALAAWHAGRQPYFEQGTLDSWAEPGARVAPETAQGYEDLRSRLYPPRPVLTEADILAD